VKPEFWLDEDIAGLSEPACLMAIGLLNYADDHGYFNANPMLIKAAIFPLREPSKTIPRIIQELSDMGYIRLFNSECGKTFGWIVNFSKHQRVDKPKDSVISKLCNFQDDSKNDLGRVPVGREGKGKEMEGNRERKKDTLVLPDWIPSSLWTDWLSVRKNKKAHNTPEAITRLINKLEKIRNAGYDISEVINHAIEKEWKGVELDWIKNSPLKVKPITSKENY